MFWEGATRMNRKVSLIFLTAVVILLAGSLLAQTPDAGATPPPADQKPAGGAPAKTNDAQSDYVIGPEDVLAINVWKEPDISRSVTVRLDGAISLPLVGEVQAAGRTTLQLKNEITKKLQQY